MTEHELFLAIGEVDNAYLAREQQPGKNRSKRILWRVGLVAAVISMLAVTVFAAPEILGALSDGKIRLMESGQPYISIYSTAGITSNNGYQVLLELDVDADAPETLEDPCLPVSLLENNLPSRCNWEKYGVICWFRYYHQDGSFTSVRFEQYTIPETVDGLYPAICRSIPGSVVKSRTFECADRTVYEVTFTNFLGSNTSRQLYWSDGRYIYYLLLEPHDIGEADYTRIIESIQRVEDMTPYVTGHGIPDVIEGEVPPSTPPEGME